MGDQLFPLSWSEIKKIIIPFPNAFSRLSEFLIYGMYPTSSYKFK